MECLLFLCHQNNKKHASIMKKKIVTFGEIMLRLTTRITYVCNKAVSFWSTTAVAKPM